jgi:hypothetical protein
VTRVRRRAVWPDRRDHETPNAHAVAAARVGDEGDGEEGDEWFDARASLTAAIVVAMERATTLPESEGDTSSFVGGAPRGP